MLLVTVPLLALVLAGLVVHTGGRHIDLEVYRLGVQAWLSGGDLYGPLPETSGHIALPFIYPPFAALLMVPWALMSWTAAWVSLLGALHARRWARTLYVVARRMWPAGGPGGALSVASIALPLALAVEPGKAIDFAATAPDPRRPPLGLEPVLQTIEFGQVNLLLMALVAMDCLVAAPALAARAADRHRGGDQADAGGVPAVLPAAPRLPGRGHRGDRRRGGHRARASWSRPAESWRFWLDNPASGVSGSPFFTNQTFQAVLVRAGVDGTGRPGRLAAAVRSRCSRWPCRSIRRAPAPLAMVATAGVGLLVSPTSWSHHWVWVAPALLVAAATAVAVALPGLAGRHGGHGRGVRARPAPVGAAPGRGAGAGLDAAAAGDRQHLRVVHRAAVRAALAGLAPVAAGAPDRGRAVTHEELVAYCLGKPGAVPDEPWEGDQVAKVGGKIFAFLGGDALGVKCGRDADEAAELRQRYPDHAAVMAYIGRHGWNTVDRGRHRARRRADRAGRRLLRRRGGQAAAAPAAVILLSGSELGR